MEFEYPKGYDPDGAGCFKSVVKLAAFLVLAGMFMGAVLWHAISKW
jgi:hypothetical protein